MNKETAMKRLTYLAAGVIALGGWAMTSGCDRDETARTDTTTPPDARTDAGRAADRTGEAARDTGRAVGEAGRDLRDTATAAGDATTRPAMGAAGDRSTSLA